jgi:tetratricopeptide (TPR) repeat protein
MLAAAAFASAMVFVSGCKSDARVPSHATPPGTGGRSSTPAHVQTSQASRPAPSADDLAEAHARYAAGLLLEMNSQLDAALDEYAVSLKKDPSNESLAMDVSRRWLLKQQPERALDIVNNFIASTGGSAPAFVRLGFIQEQLGHPEDAKAAYRKAIQCDPDSLDGYRGLFSQLAREKKNEEAAKVLDQAAARGTVDAGFLVNLAELNSALGRIDPKLREKTADKARELLFRAARQDLDECEPEVVIKLADGLTTVGESDRAMPLYRTALEKIDDASPMAHNIRARLIDHYIRKGENDRAREQIEKVLAENPANAQGHFLLGELAQEQTNFVQAAECYSRAILMNPDLEMAYYGLARARIALNQYAEACVLLDKAAGRFQENFQIRFLKGIAFSQRQDYTNAIANFTAAEIQLKVSNNPDLREALCFHLGTTYERMGDIPQAVRCLEECLKLDPTNASALNYLGYIWADRGENLQRALKLIESALQIEPDNPAFLDSLGWVYFKQGNPAGALPVLEKSSRLIGGKDATVLEHLGDVHAALQDWESARRCWKESLAIESNDKVKKKLEESAGREKSGDSRKTD